MAKSGVGGLVKWLLVPVATLVVGYMLVGPQLGGRIVSTASKNLPIPKEVKASVSKALTSPVAKNEPERDEPAPEQEPQPKAVLTDNEPKQASTRTASKSAGPEVEVSVREATVLDSNRTPSSRERLDSSRTVSGDAAQTAPKKKKRRKPRKATTTEKPVVRQPEVLDEGGSGGAIGDPASGGADPAGAPPPQN
jgi:hypothetical protein